MRLSLVVAATLCLLATVSCHQPVSQAVPGAPTSPSAPTPTPSTPAGPSISISVPPSPIRVGEPARFVLHFGDIAGSVIATVTFDDGITVTFTAASGDRDFTRTFRAEGRYVMTVTLMLPDSNSVATSSDLFVAP